MSQQPQMNMAAMGGPVGGAVGPQMSVGTPGSSGASLTQDETIKRLNTAIYDYLLRNELYDIAKQFHVKMPIEIKADTKQSPNQRGGQQANGVDDSMDEIKDPAIMNRPDGLPLPSGVSGPFLQDWWCQFWEVWASHRNKSNSPNARSYVAAQRSAAYQRNSMMNANGMQNMRGFNGMMPGMQNGMGMSNDLKRAAMQNQQRNLTPAQIQQMQKMQNPQQNGQMMQAGNQMERSGSQMENMSGPRSGSPGSGDAPSPKRQRLEGNMQAMNQGRPGQPGQMQGNQSSLDIYSKSMQDNMQAAMRNVNQASSNVNKGIPPNMGPGGAQGSPMSQPGMDGATGEFYAAAANGTGGRMAMPANAAAAGAAGQAGNNNGNHALQDYQMQLMLLEQQNKKRLLMARQEQDNMAHPAGVGPNPQFLSGSPQGSQRGGDPSPNPNDMGRGSPQPGMMDPNSLPPAMRAQMMQAPNGQMMRQAPSSHPMAANMNQQQQLEMMRSQGLVNGQFPPGAQPPQGQVMPGGQPQPGQQPGQPMGTPRQNNMPPPPAPQANASGGPSSPSQQPAPPTPSQTSKTKPGTKKETAKKGAAQKKGGANATPASESENPPTPVAPITPVNAASFNKNQQLPNGQPTSASAQSNAQANNQQQQGQQQNQQQNANTAQQAASSGQPDLSEPFGSIGGNEFGMGLDFPMGGDGGDVLENFDFDSFLNADGFDNFGLEGVGGLEFDTGIEGT